MGRKISCRQTSGCSDGCDAVTAQDAWESLHMKKHDALHGCFQKQGYPQIMSFNRGFHSKPSSILGYPYFWKHPHTCKHVGGFMITIPKLTGSPCAPQWEHGSWQHRRRVSKRHQWIQCVYLDDIYSYLLPCRVVIYHPFSKRSIFPCPVGVLIHSFAFCRPRTFFFTLTCLS